VWLLVTDAAPAADEPDLLDVMYRAGGGRWSKLGTLRGYKAAVRLIDGAGDWWLKRAGGCGEDLGLFDAEGREQ
jgi:hypothetical protein